MKSLKTKRCKTEQCHEGCVGSLKRSLLIFWPLLIFRGSFPLLMHVSPRESVAILAAPRSKDFFGDSHTHTSHRTMYWQAFEHATSLFPQEPGELCPPFSRDRHGAGACASGYSFLTPWKEVLFTWFSATRPTARTRPHDAASQCGSGARRWPPRSGGFCHCERLKTLISYQNLALF